MLVADDGLALVRFDDAALAPNSTTVALGVIPYGGGLGSEPAAFGTEGIPAGFLATVGVAVTAGVVAFVAWLVLDVEGSTALLLGSVAASRRSAREVLYFHEGLAANAQGVLFLRSLRPPRAVPY